MREALGSMPSTKKQEEKNKANRIINKPSIYFIIFGMHQNA